MHLYLKSVPRALYLVTNSQDERSGRPSRALVFRAGDALPKAIVEFLAKDQIDMNTLVKLSSRNVTGCLGLISIENGMCNNSTKFQMKFCFLIFFIMCTPDTFLAVVTSATEVGNTRPSAIHTESVARIHEVCFYSLTSSTWDEIPSVEDAFGSPDAPDSSYRDTYAQTPPVFEHPCLPLTKILSSGSFYYALNSQWDISSRLAIRLSRDPSVSKEQLVYDERFVWNEYIIRSLLDFRERLDPSEKDDFDRCQFLVRPVFT